MAKTPQEYEWSSYRSYAGLAEIPEWLTVDDLPKYFSIAEQGKDMLAFTEEDGIGALLEPMRQEESENIFTSSRCLKRPVVDRSYYLAPASLAEIINVVMEHYGVGSDTLLSSRAKVRNIPRDVCMFLSRTEACMKILEIANAFKIRQAAASTAVSRIKRQMPLDIQIKQDIFNLKTRINIRRKRVPAWMEFKNI